MRAKQILEKSKEVSEIMKSYGSLKKFLAAQNIILRESNLNPDLFKAYVTDITGNKKVITINSKYRNLPARAVLIAHELGHIYLHDNNFYTGYNDNNVDKEYEANLFAIGLLYYTHDLDPLVNPIDKISPYELKYEIDNLIKSAVNI